MNCRSPDRHIAMEAVKPFAIGSVAGCCAASVIQPVDMVKVRIQLGAAEGGSTSPIKITKQIMSREGPLAFYQGLSAAYMRQVLYTGSRLGLYDKFTGIVAVPGQPLPFWKTTICALSAGGIAAVVGTPADLTLIRMQADTMLPEAERRNYKHVFHAFRVILTEEGPMGMFKGAAPTATRAMALNFGLLSFNTQAKQKLSDLGYTSGGFVQIWGAATIGGFFAALFSLPFDFVKTQMQKMKPDAMTGELPYKGPLDCVVKTVATGGPSRFYAGFPTYFMRVAPLSTITLIAQDFLKKTWERWGS